MNISWENSVRDKVQIFCIGLSLKLQWVYHILVKYHKNI